MENHDYNGNPNCSSGHEIIHLLYDWENYERVRVNLHCSVNKNIALSASNFGGSPVWEPVTLTSGIKQRNQRGQRDRP